MREICGNDDLHFETVRELLDIERRHRNQIRRSGLFPSLEKKALIKGFYTDKVDAVDFARRQKAARDAVNADVLSSGVIQPSLDADPDGTLAFDDFR